jgi:segregation and condensation protein B
MANNLKAAVEALLFTYGEPTKIKKLAQTLETDEETVNKTLGELRAQLETGERGLKLMVHGDSAALVTTPELGTLLSRVIKEELDAELTPASLETLAVVAYLGPCSRAEIEYIRGVNSSFILRSLSVRGLIEKKAAERSGNPHFYQVTSDFLRHIGLRAPTELPEYEKYHELARKLRENNETEQTK